MAKTGEGAFGSMQPPAKPKRSPKAKKNSPNRLGVPKKRAAKLRLAPLNPRAGGPMKNNYGVSTPESQHYDVDSSNIEANRVSSFLFFSNFSYFSRLQGSQQQERTSNRGSMRTLDKQARA